MNIIEQLCGKEEEINKNKDSTYAFLFDLDGTIVISDHIYVSAWKNILDKYNIFVDETFFNEHIQGNSDLNVIKKLLPNININIELENITKMKNDYFIENINKVKIIENSIQFINEIKENGYKIAVVTNCSRIVAENILENINILNTIDLLVIGDECKKAKPYPDPYLEAMNKLNISNDRCFIFEDSYSGLLSARSSHPKCLIGIDYLKNNYNNLIKHGANIVINNYNNLEEYNDNDIDSSNNLLHTILNYKNNDDEINNLKVFIYESLKYKYDINDIIIHNNNLKGGYISDVIKVDIKLKDELILNTIFKKENKNENNLSNMAKKLDLYEREYYFYENISNYLNVKIPKFYGIIRNENMEKIGLILEDINTKNFVLNLDLNKETIDTTLIYISNIAKMHVRFSDKNLIEKFRGLHRQNSKQLNSDFVCNFIKENTPLFISKWNYLLNDILLEKIQIISTHYNIIQNKLSEGLLTLCHGDFKSPNIFCKTIDEYLHRHYEPYLIDWQYISEGKGIQDIIFFMIESFESKFIENNYNIIIDYYYNKLIESEFSPYAKKYDKNLYHNDIKYSICYFPMFVSIWFGTVDQDELIDKNFPFIFINKFLFFLDRYVDIEFLRNLIS